MFTDSVTLASHVKICPSPKSRKPTQGPELEMVYRFLENAPAFGSLFKGDDYYLFFEPAIDSGFPDLVIVQYDSSSCRSWVSLRNTLDSSDLRLLASILTHRPSKLETISKRSGFSYAEVSVSLELLSSCGLIEKSGAVWRPANKDSFFAIRRIVSIEAKIGNTRIAARQALMNKRFASESYILVDSSFLSKRTLELCRSYEIGAIVQGGQHIQEYATPGKIPINHISLLFNEWICEAFSRKFDDQIR